MNMKAIIWPVYIDSKKSKHEGRKISMEHAVEKYKSYSRSWWETSGRVIVDKNMPKREILIKICKMIQGVRDK
jgi:signal recognition particle subunit SRP19